MRRFFLFLLLVVVGCKPKPGELQNDGRPQASEHTKSASEAKGPKDKKKGDQFALANISTSAPPLESGVTTIPDYNTNGVEIPLEISEPVTLADVSLELKITHDYPTDLRIQLIHPSGYFLPVTLRPYNTSGSHSGYIYETYYFNEIPEDIASGSVPVWVAGLEEFVGENAQGTWKVLIQDNYWGDIGTLVNESVKFHIKGLEAAPKPGSVATPKARFFSETDNSRIIPDNVSYLQTTFSVSDLGDFSGAMVYVDIAHNRIGDLVVKLVHPDNSEYLLHDREGGANDDILKWYGDDTPLELPEEWYGKPIAGDWRIRVMDRASGSSGRLNAVKLILLTDTPEPYLSGPSDAGDGGGYTVEKTNIGKSITDNNTTYEYLTFDTHETITDIEVAVDISHTYVGDLSIKIKSPSGRTVTLHNHLWGNQDDLDVIYGSHSHTVIPELKTQFVDTSTDVYGTWTFTVYDSASGDRGTLNSVRISVNGGGQGAILGREPFAQVSGISEYALPILTVKSDGTFKAYFNPVDELGYIDLESNSRVNCIPFQPEGFTASFDTIKECVFLQSLTDVSTSYSYSNGQKIRIGDNFYYADGQLMGRLDGSWFYRDGSLLKTTDGHYFWPDGTYMVGHGGLSYSKDGYHLSYDGNIYFDQDKHPIFYHDRDEHLLYKSGSFLRRDYFTFLYPGESGEIEGPFLADDFGVLYWDGEVLKDDNGLYNENGSSSSSPILKSYDEDDVLTIIEASQSSHRVAVVQTPTEDSTFFAVLSPNGPPRPRNLTVQEASGQPRYTLKWDYNVSGVSGYIVGAKVATDEDLEYTRWDCEKEDQWTRTYGTDVVGTSKQYVFDNLLTETDYVLGVCAVMNGEVSLAAITHYVAPRAGNPTAPSSLYSTDVTDDSARLYWYHGSNNGGWTIGYSLSYMEDSVPSYSDKCETQQTISTAVIGKGTSYTVEGLTENTTYGFRLCAENGNVPADVVSGPTRTFTTQKKTPPVPTNFEVTDTTVTSIKVSWESGGENTQGFKICTSTYSSYMSSSCSGTTLDKDTTEFTVNNLSGNSTIYFALFSFGNGTYPAYSSRAETSATTQQAAPGNPTSLSLDDSTPNSLHIDWYAPYSSYNYVIGGYRLAYQEGSTPPPESCVAGSGVTVVEASSSSYLVSGLDVNTQYSFRVCTKNTANPVQVSTGATYTARTESVPAPNPTNLTVTDITTSSATINWASGGGTTGGFRVAYSTSSYPYQGCSGGYTVSSDTTSYQLSVWPNQTYYVRVCATRPGVNADNSSGVYTSFHSEQTDAVDASGLTFTKTSTTMQVSWTSPPTTFDLSGYLFTYGTSPRSEDCADEGAVTLGASATSRSLTGLDPDTVYHFRICSLKDGGGTSAGLVGSQKTMRSAAPDPSELTRVEYDTDSLSIGIAPGGSEIGGYRVAYYLGTVPPSPRCTDGLWATIDNLSEFSIDGLLPNKLYSFRVCSLRAGGDAEISDGITQTFRTRQTGPTDTESASASIAYGDTLPKVSWQAISGTDAFNLGGYRLAYSTLEMPPERCAESNQVIIVDTDVLGTTTQYTLPSANRDITYYFRLCTANTEPDADFSIGKTAQIRVPLIWDSFDRPNSDDIGPTWMEETGTWRISDGTLQPGGPEEGEDIVRFSNVVLKDAEISVDVKVGQYWHQDTAQACIRGRRVSSGFYMACLYNSWSGGKPNFYARLYKFSGTSYTLFGSRYVDSVGRGVISLRMVGNQISALYNGEEKVSVTDSQFSSAGIIQIVNYKHNDYHSAQLSSLDPNGVAIPVLPFADDFNRVDDGVVGPHWSDMVGNARVAGSQVHSDQASLSILHALTASDVDVQFDAYPENGDVDSVAVVRYVNPSNYYYGGVRDVAGVKKAVIGRKVAGADTILASADVSGSQWNTRLLVSDSKLVLFVNDQKIQASDGALSQPGAIGFVLTKGSLDNFKALDFSNMPLAGELESPIGNTVVEQKRPRLSWEEMINAETYEIELDDLDTLASPDHVIDSISNHWWNPSFDLALNHQYEWRVRGINAVGDVGEWTSFGMFTVYNPNAILPAPVLSWPIFDESVEDLRPRFVWDPVEDALRYDVWVDDLTTGANKVLFETTAGDGVWTASSDLVPGHVYRWWVRASNENGDRGLWSEGHRFSIKATGSIPGQIVLTAPENGAALELPRPELSWQPDAVATSYDVWVNDRTTGMSRVVEKTGLVDTAWTLDQDLVIGRQYDWWVRGRTDADVVGPWSEVGRFSISGSGLTTRSELLSPDRNVITSVRPQFVWGASTNTGTYEIWINDLTDGISKAYYDASVSGTSWTPPSDLTPSHKYRWWVRGAGEWSLPRDFTVTAVMPTLQQPLPDALLTSLRPTLVWEDVGSSLYEVWINDMTSGQSQWIRKQGITGTSWTLDQDLVGGHEYRWWVKGEGTLWSQARTFYKKSSTSVPTAVTLVEPGAGASVLRRPVFSWEAKANADHYEIIVSNITAGVLAYSDQSVTGVSWEPSEDLISGHTYRWWVRAVAANGAFGAWSSPSDFLVDNGLSPGAPALEAPVDDQQVSDVSPTFVWSRSDGADYYDIWVNDLTTGGSQVIYEVNLGETSWESNTNLISGHRYRWWVRSRNSSGVSAWSAAADFNVE